jgi:aspartate/tyrosine/aromatic aminotransferase
LSELHTLQITRFLTQKISEVKMILSEFTYPNIRRIAGAHGHFTSQDWDCWLERADREDLAYALNRLAQLNQTKVYLFWKNH